MQHTPSRSADKTEIVEFGHVIFDDGGGISEFRAAIFIIASPNGDKRSVFDST